jgi:hypothetical protein
MMAACVRAGMTRRAYKRKQGGEDKQERTNEEGHEAEGMICQRFDPQHVFTPRHNVEEEKGRSGPHD